jgi:hypothetical protein
MFQAYMFWRHAKLRNDAPKSEKIPERSLAERGGAVFFDLPTSFCIKGSDSTTGLVAEDGMARRKAPPVLLGINGGGLKWRKNSQNL